ncbi:Diacetylchitobiose uptake system permease protein DasC [Paenibacillus sp. CECT 9249]|uniref:carbohydrate ABC transporter permease n=1 Tax=Paenibacillus sp. CECT 9249 TaxID=2845385 RepID=UPI001E4B6437|nr:carbohydrate ABC transporter permease [Paenibacillus sp. CECT 9249]CAH0120692.1 Diacetylchitobiose uptake system permease protein DasC [Paenibacillus sp. CECT 9249]
MYGKSSLPVEILRYLALGIYLVIVVFPLYWMMITSLKPKKDIFGLPIQYWPKQFSFENYENIFQITKFHIYIGNSLIVSLAAAFVVLVIATLSAYVLARYKFKGSRQIMFMFFLTQVIPAFIGFAPLYLMLTKMNLTNTLPGLVIVYTVMCIPFSTIMLQGFFQRVPSSLEEAAQIDGCSRLGALVRVILPVMLPGLSATFIFSFVQNWNELFVSVMLIDSEHLKTIPVAMNSFITKFDVDWGSMSAATVLSVLPTMVLFALCQRLIVEGLTQGAEKG